MLQQTRVATVLGYYTRFLDRFPDVRALAAAPLERVLQLWAGLGYYARARHAHACARIVVREHAGKFPGSARELAALPGIGASTAAAIAAFCYHERAAILDANVQRVLARQFAIEGDPRRQPVRVRLQRSAEELLPASANMPRYTQAIMDLGATVCTRSQPRCAQCPVRQGCRAFESGRTQDLPGRDAAQVRPVRATQLLLAVHRRAVLVEERAPRGVWGGLLAPPQYASRAALVRAARRLGPESTREMAARRHSFTHFTLSFTPHVLRLAGPRPDAAGGGRRWLRLDEIEGAALPAPILRLLQDVRESPRGGESVRPVAQGARPESRRASAPSL